MTRKKWSAIVLHPWGFQYELGCALPSFEDEHRSEEDEENRCKDFGLLRAFSSDPPSSLPRLL